jgi:RNA-directed DNA polymerase
LAKDRIHQDIGPEKQADEWFSINWKSVEKRVTNLRQRIYRATERAQWKQVRSLMKLMLRSYSNLLLSVRRVTQINQGKRTPGVDRQVVSSPKGKMALVQRMLDYSFWQAKPVRRIYIPKVGGKRPLGIPTIKNRVTQAIVKNALEPSWEARFEAHSYGFRPGRSCHDAIEQCWRRLNQHSGDRWLLDADIKGAFDNISHEHIIKAIGPVPGRELIKQWLKAGYVEAEILHETTSGVPQGGVISPLLANVALDGMQQLLKGKFGFIRYADDFVVTAKSKEQIEAIVPLLKEWLQQRGLVMHEEKTRIASINDGFNFLGFSIRHYSGKCLVKPQNEKVLLLLRDIREWLSANKQIEAWRVIRKLNPILIGWTNYHESAVSTTTFSYVAYEVWKALWNWCLRRHPKKGKDWVKRKYFGHRHGRAWVFQAVDPDAGTSQMVQLVNITRIPIERHTKVRGSASPDNPDLKEYWQKRKATRRRLAQAPGSISTVASQLLEA